MNPTKSSIFAAAGVALAALAVVFGSSTRERIDLGSLGERSSNLSGLVASQSDIPEGDYFREMVHLLKREYVEPIGDDRMLAIGAIKGMVNSLKDPRCQFMDPNEYRVFVNSLNGKYEGIGADLILDMHVGKGHGGQSNADDLDAADVQSLAIPRLTVVSVVPGGPAAQAGVKPGDWVDSVNDHWVLNPEIVEQFRDASVAASPAATKNLSPDQVKKRQATARKIGTELRSLLKSMIMPLKAKDMLTMGTTDSIKVVWHRNSKLVGTTIPKKESHVELVQTDGPVVALRFGDTSAERLKTLVAGKRALTLDLRENAVGSFQAMRDCMSLLAPAGTYGEIRSEKPGKSKPLSLTSGNPKPPKLTLLVDSTTRGPAEIFSKALAAKGIAKLSGSTAGDNAVLETISLPDGSGYTLVMGEYRAKAESKPAAKRVAAKARPSVSPIAMREPDGSMVAMLNTGGNS